MVQFENIEMLVLIIPVIIAGLFLMKKGARKGLIISRILVAILLVVALASPFTIVPRVTSDDNPELIIISDETNSMELFENETSAKLYEVFTSKTPTSLVRLTGESTALGDAIIQYSTGDNQIVLVTDGNSNTGEELEDALQFAQETGTTVYLVQPELEENDLSVQIEGDKTVVYKTDNEFTLVVTQAMEEEVSYSYVLYLDDIELRSAKKITQTEREKEIRITADGERFSKLGAHTLKAVITPSGSDVDDINNVFYKSIYVIPKSNALLITADRNSDLAQNLYDIYDLTIKDDLSKASDIVNQKAIILDNIHESTISEEDIEKLKDYISSGHGLYVIGGDKSFNEGNYLNSSFEDLLPVISKPTESSGGKDVVLILDLSGSTLSGGNETVTIGRVTQSTPTYPAIIQSAQNIIDSPDFEDATLGIIVIGNYVGEVPDDMYELIVPQNKNLLNESLQNIEMKADSLYETDLNGALNNAIEMINREIKDDGDAPKSVIIISDGSAGTDLSYYDTSYYDAKETASTITEMINDNYYVYFVHIKSNTKYQTDSEGNVLAEEFITSLGGTYIPPVSSISEATVSLNEEELTDETDEDGQNSFEVYEYNQKHFITNHIDVTGSITGYNQVTPKAGSERLLVTSNGINILTTWRYGLGRVASLATDNGKANGWSNDLYKNSPNLTSSTINWVIGNPREETGAVVEAEDTWYGTPVTIELTMYDEGIPTLKLDDEEVDLSLTGTNVYEATIDPGSIGIHDLSGYPVAVNYALEYRDVGLNEELPSLIKAYGGSTYTVNQARNNLLEEAQGNSEKLVRDSVSQKIYFLLAALIIFLGEVILRRIREIKEMKKLEQEIRT